MDQIQSPLKVMRECNTPYFMHTSEPWSGQAVGLDEGPFQPNYFILQNVHIKSV